MERNKENCYQMFVCDILRFLLYDFWLVLHMISYKMDMMTLIYKVLIDGI